MIIVILLTTYKPVVRINWFQINANKSMVMVFERQINYHPTYFWTQTYSDLYVLKV